MKKKYLICSIIALFFVTNIFAQKAPGWCGSHLPAGSEQKYVLERNEMLKQYPQKNQRAATKYVPIKFHLVGDSDGKGYFSTSQVLTILDELNEHFDSMDIRFFLWEGINYIPNSYYYSFTDAQEGRIDQLFNAYNVTKSGSKSKPDIINVYITNQPTTYLCGRSAFTFMSSPHAMIMANKCSGPGQTTFPHEMGHYFDLFHTFQGGNELVSRDSLPNCATAGDGFCDTPADPSAGRAPCPYNAGEKDVRGDTYNPDETLFMSYFNDECTFRFSPEERNSAYQTLVNGGRKNLLNHQLPPMDTITELATLILPVHNDPVVAPNSADLSWTKVPGATHYSLMISQSLSFSSPAVDIIVADTTYRATNLAEFKTYHWKVKAIHSNYTGTPYTTHRTFNTSERVDTTGINDVSDNENIKVYPNPVAGNQTLSLLIGQNQSQEAVIEIIDNKGALISKEKINLQAGQTNYTFKVATLSAGLYIAKININGKPVLRKFQVIK